MPIEPSTPWETARPQLEKEPEFEAVSQEFERQRIYKEFMKGINIRIFKKFMKSRVKSYFCFFGEHF